MPRADEYLDLVDDPSGTGLVPGHPADDALIALLAAVAFSDGEVDDNELDFLCRVLPGRDPEDLREWAIEAGARPLDLEAVAEVLPGADERWAALRFAGRMAFKDGVLANEEQVFLTRLAWSFGLPEGALERVLSEMQGRATRKITPDQVDAAIKAVGWDAVQHGTGDLRSDLGNVVPKGAKAVGRVGLEGIEVLGFFHEGLAGRFLEGNAFLAWDDVVTYSRVPTLASSIQVITEGGQRWSLVDHRLNGLATFFDRLYGATPPERKGKPVKIERVRGQ